MKPFVCACLFLACASLSPAQLTGSIPANAKIYIDATSGFDKYLSAALAKKRVPLTITTQKEEADYELQALSAAQPIPASDWQRLWLRGYGEAGIRVIDLHTGNTVFYSGLNRNQSLHTWDTAAKACAGNLKIGVNRAESRIRSVDPILDF